MKSLICLVITGLFVGITPVHAGQSRGNANFKVAKSVDKYASDVDIVVRASLVWAPREIEVIRAHYAPQHRNLPPGLQKKVARGGQLPPGWQKKMQPFPVKRRSGADAVAERIFAWCLRRARGDLQPRRGRRYLRDPVEQKRAAPAAPP